MGEKQPMQPMFNDDGVVRFRENAVVRYLLDFGGIDLNKLTSLRCCRRFNDADWCQFMQLIGYSLAGYHELSQVPDSFALEASSAARARSTPLAGRTCEASVATRPANNMSSSVIAFSAAPKAFALIAYTSALVATWPTRGPSTRRRSRRESEARDE